jgi:predicted acetyltransferase
MSFAILKPTLALLPSYVAALEAGWSPDNVRQEKTAREQLERIAIDPQAFVDSLDNPKAVGDPIALPDGSFVQRLPNMIRWMWDGEFCGSIGFRWQPGTSELLPHVLGHIGYGVVPWKRGRGYARQALTAILPEARRRGMPYVELTTDPDNPASQKVITACGGVLVERFRKVEAYGGGEALRFRIELDSIR